MLFDPKNLFTPHELKDKLQVGDILLYQPADHPTMWVTFHVVAIDDEGIESKFINDGLELIADFTGWEEDFKFAWLRPTKLQEALEKK